MMLAAWLLTFVALMGAGMSADVVIHSVTFETRRWQHKSDGGLDEAPKKPVDSKTIYLSLPLGMPGYAQGPKTLTIFGTTTNTGGSEHVNNREVFKNGARAGAEDFLAFHHQVKFRVNKAGTFEARIGADYGKGGTLLLDDVPVDFVTTDMWWSESWTSSKNGRLQHLHLQPRVLQPGEHVIDSYGFDQCCDGYQAMQWRFDRGSWANFAAPNNTVPKVRLEFVPSQTCQTASPGCLHCIRYPTDPRSTAVKIRYFVTDPDVGATFKVASLSCGKFGVLGAFSVTTDQAKQRGTFECKFFGGSTIAMTVEDDRKAESAKGSLDFCAGTRVLYRCALLLCLCWSLCPPSLFVLVAHDNHVFYIVVPPSLFVLVTHDNKEFCIVVPSLFFFSGHP